MFHNLILGLTALGTGQAIGLLVAGSLLGVFVGVIPGLGLIVILTILLAFYYHMGLVPGVALFLGVQAGSFFSASVTAILLNTPGAAESFPVTFDGYPMAQRGEAGRALGISASSTMVGGLVGCLILVGFLQIINYFPSFVHPPEYVAICILALVLTGTLGTDSALKALMSASVGLMLACVGTDFVTGLQRYDFGSVTLLNGVSLVALGLGCFAIPQMMTMFGSATAVGTAGAVQLEAGFGRQVIIGIRETASHWVALIRAGVVGAICGVIPGIGALAANFLSYSIAKQTSKRRREFGTGIPEGIIAPEGASLAKEAGGLVPLIGLGVPSGIATALFIAALGEMGVHTGYGFAAQYPSLVYTMVWSIAIGGTIGTMAGLLAAPILARITRVPGPLLLPFVMAFAVIGTFASQDAFFNIVEMLIFVPIGLTLRRLKYSVASFAVGLVLGPTFEQNIWLASQVDHGWKILSRPAADIIFIIAVGALALKVVQMRTEAKRLRLSDLAGEGVTDSVNVQQHNLRNPYPLLGLVACIALFAAGLWYTIYGIKTLDFKTGLLPICAGTLCTISALCRTPFEVAILKHSRALRSDLVVADAVSGVPPKSQSIYASDGATGDEQLPPIVTNAWGRYGQYTREITAFGWFVFLVTSCALFGFYVGVPLFCVLYILTGTRRVLPSVRSRIVLALTGAAIMWGVQDITLNALHYTFTPLWF